MQPYLGRKGGKGPVQIYLIPWSPTLTFLKVTQLKCLVTNLKLTRLRFGNISLNMVVQYLHNYKRSHNT